MKTIRINYYLNVEKITLKGIRDFTDEKKAETFLERLTILKAKIAMRASGWPPNKKSDILRGYKLTHSMKANEWTKKAVNAMFNHPGKLSVQIQTI
jgi:hypothetical protein